MQFLYETQMQAIPVLKPLLQLLLMQKSWKSNVFITISAKTLKSNFVHTTFQTKHTKITKTTIRLLWKRNKKNETTLCYHVFGPGAYCATDFGPRVAITTPRNDI